MSAQLFTLPEYNTAAVLFMGKTINDLMRRKDQVLSQIRSHDVADIPKTQVTTASGEVVETAPILCQMEFSMALSDSVAGNLEGFATSLNAAAESGLQSLMPQIYASIGQVCAATGNIIDATGQTFSHELFLQMIETLDIHFGEDGKHNLTWVMHPTMLEKLNKLPLPTEEQNKALEELLDRKRREFNERKRQRQLTRPQRQLR